MLCPVICGWYNHLSHDEEHRQQQDQSGPQARQRTAGAVVVDESEDEADA